MAFFLNSRLVFFSTEITPKSFHEPEGNEIPEIKEIEFQSVFSFSESSPSPLLQAEPIKEIVRPYTLAIPGIGKASMEIVYFVHDYNTQKNIFIPGALEMAAKSREDNTIYYHIGIAKDYENDPSTFANEAATIALFELLRQNNVDGVDTLLHLRDKKYNFTFEGREWTFKQLSEAVGVLAEIYAVGGAMSIQANEIIQPEKYRSIAQLENSYQLIEYATQKTSNAFEFEELIINALQAFINQHRIKKQTVLNELQQQRNALVRKIETPNTDEYFS